MLGDRVRRCHRDQSRFLLALLLVILLTWTIDKSTALHGHVLHADAERDETEESPWCQTTFNHGYLTSFSNSVAQYCKSNSLASLTCYSHRVDPREVRHDSFCLGNPANIELDPIEFNLHCDPTHSPKNKNGSSMPSLPSFPRYWYETGPAYLFQHFIEIEGDGSTVAKYARTFNSSLPTVVLVKREIANFNIWHNLLEIMSVTHSLDIVSMDIGNMWSSPNRDNIHVLVLDDHENGPYHEIWQILTPNSVLRVSDLANIPMGNIIVPIPGGANPLWQGDWVDLNCTRSSLLSTFRRRIIDHFGLSVTSNSSTVNTLRITVINRTTKRRLLHQDELVAVLKDTFPEHNVQLIDFANLPFRDQLSIVYDTDVLVGVHGAGLTHGMFLPFRSAIVEFMPHNLDHRGFRNMARMLGHSYHGAKTIKPDNAENKGDWQADDVEVDQDVFLREVKSAIGGVTKERANSRYQSDRILDVWD